MAVHLPLALMVLWPLVDLVGLVAGRIDVNRVAVGLLVLAIFTALFATVSGQAAYDAAVLAGHKRVVLDAHADNADLVPWLLIVLAVLRIAGEKKVGRPAHIAALVLGVGLAGFAFVVGNSGGELVYGHRVGVRTTHEANP